MEGYELTVDPENLNISDTEGFRVQFETDSFRRDCLLEGLDDIGLTLQVEDKIKSYEETRS